MTDLAIGIIGDYGLAPIHRSRVEEGGLRTTGIDRDGEARILELPSHPHYLATLFVPQVGSRPDNPHPLILGFLRAARTFSEGRARG